MKDQRAEALAQILVRYSTKVAEGDVVSIQGPTTAEPLLEAIYAETVRAGGLPLVNLAMENQGAIFYELASDRQLEWIPPTAEWIAEHADVRISVMGETNPHELSQIDPARQAKAARARKPLLETSMRRSAAGEYRWSLTMFPTQAYASEAGMSLGRYEDFYYAACMATDADPVGAWLRTADEVRRLAEWTEGRKEVRIVADGTDVRLGIEGRRFIPCVGEHNMPDGEFFTAPVEDSVEGVVQYSFPAVYGGREVSNVRLRFEGGRVVDASADRGEDFLVEMLDADEGARRLGELGIGTNYGIATATKEILLDEKIGGTVHLAVGMSYPETGGVNSSAVHWDMVCDLRRGGRIEVDGELLQENGRFVV